MTTTPTPHTNINNRQSPLDNTRPFMDDTGRLLTERSSGTLTSPVVRARSALRLALLNALLWCLRSSGRTIPRGLGHAIGSKADDRVTLLARSRAELRHPGVERTGRARVDSVGLHLHDHRLRQAPVRAVAGACVERLAELIAGLLELFQRLAGEAAARVQEPQERADALRDREQGLVIDRHPAREVLEQVFGQVRLRPVPEATVVMAALPLQHRRGDQITVLPHDTTGRVRGLGMLLELVEQSLHHVVKNRLILGSVDDQFRVVVLPRRQHQRPRQTRWVANQRARDDRQCRPALVPERDLRIDRPSRCGQDTRGQLGGCDRSRRGCALDAVQ
jgi:hypothetical protein